MTTREKPQRKKPGPFTHFPNKNRNPFALCLTPELHVTLQRTADRLHMKRGDVICFLLQQFADELVVAPRAPRPSEQIDLWVA